MHRVYRYFTRGGLLVKSNRTIGPDQSIQLFSTVVLLGKLIRCTECWKTAGRITIRQTVMQSTYSRYDSKKETILQGRTKTYKLNIQQRYIWVADQERCCRQSTKFTWCRSTNKKMKSVDVSQERGNKSGPKDKAQRMGAPRPSLT